MTVPLQAEIERKLSGRMAVASRAFLWLTAAAIIATLLALAFVQRWFTPTLDLYFYTEHASGLTRGMAVKLIGFNVGRLAELSPFGELRVRGKVVIDRQYRNVISQDSRIRLTKEGLAGLLGSNILELVPGTGDVGLVEDGASLQYERNVDYSIMVQNLVDRVGPVVEDVRKVTSQLGDPDVGIQKSMRHFNEAAGGLAETSRAIRKLAATGVNLAQDASKVTRDVPARLEPVLADLQRSLAQVEKLVTQLNAAVPPTVDDTRKLLQSARQATESAQRVIAEDVPPLVRQGETVLNDTDQVVTGVKRSWPVRTMVPQAEQKVIELDSADGAVQAPAQDRTPHER